MFCVMSYKTVQNPQNSNKNNNDNNKNSNNNNKNNNNNNNNNNNKKTQSFPFIKQHLCATSLNINHKIPFPCFCH